MGQFKPLFSNKLQLRQHGRAQRKGFYNQNLPVMEQTGITAAACSCPLTQAASHYGAAITTHSTIHLPRPREAFVPAPESRTTPTRLASVGGGGEVRRSENSNKNRQLLMPSSLGWGRDCARGNSAKDQNETTPKKLLPFWSCV